MTGTKKKVLEFIESKGVEIKLVSDDSLLLEYIQSVDFMELIVYLEKIRGSALDLATADIEKIMTVGGFIEWVQQEDA